MQNNKGNTALIEACIYQNYTIADTLINNKANINIKNNKGNTALIETCILSNIHFF